MYMADLQLGQSVSHSNMRERGEKGGREERGGESGGRKGTRREEGREEGGGE